MGSTGTLSALMDKEMEILQARRSCSVSHNHNIMHCKKSPSSPKDYPNTLYASYTSIFGPSANSSLMSPPSSYTNLVSSLWSDLKSLMLRSPPSLHHHRAHTPLIYAHTNAALFCQEQLEINYEHYAALICNKKPPLSFTPSHPSPLTTLSHPSPKKACPNKAMPHSQRVPAHIVRSPSSKETTYPKEKVAAEASPYSSSKPSMHDGYIRSKKADYPHWISPLHHNCSQDRLVSGAPDYPNGKSPLHYRSQERSDSACCNRKDEDYYQVIPTATDQESWKGKGGSAKELAGTSAAKIYPKGKTMDAKSPNVQNPTCPKALAMDAMYAMRRSSAVSDAHISKNGKAMQEKNAKLEGARTSAKSRMQNEVGKREERECLRKIEEREGLQSQPCTPASSPLNLRPCFKPSRSLGGRALPLVSVVDLQCCQTPDSSSRRLSFTRLSSF